MQKIETKSRIFVSTETYSKHNFSYVASLYKMAKIQVDVVTLVLRLLYSGEGHLNHSTRELKMGAKWYSDAVQDAFLVNTAHSALLIFL